MRTGALPCDGTASQLGWAVDPSSHAIKHGGLCLAKESEDSVALAACDGDAAQHFTLDPASGALIHVRTLTCTLNVFDDDR